METAIGVFSSRERAEEAVSELVGQKSAARSNCFPDRSETEAKTVGKGTRRNTR